MNATPQVKAHVPRSKRKRTRQEQRALAEKFKRRMLAWPNPVEYVNNMYGCHPGESDTDYFKEVFGE